MEQSIEAERPLAEAAELHIRAAQLTVTADLLLSQAEQLAARAAGLSERGLRLLGVQEEPQH